MKIGIDIGGSHIAIGVVDSNGQIIERMEKRLKSAEKKMIEKSIEEYITENIEKLIQKYKITNIGIAIPGTVTKSIVVKSVNLGLKNYEIVKRLEDNIPLPITIRNDAKCAALAENIYGCLKMYDRSIFLTLGTGIGGAVMINHKLLDTGSLPGCEIGHMSIEKDGVLCGCGRKGCFERYASMKVLKDNIRKALGYDEKVSGKEIFEIIRSNRIENKNYEIIEGIIKEYIENLSIGIANLVNIFEPEAIGIGGSFVYFEEVLLERLKEELLSKKMLFNPREEIIIKTAVLGNDAGIIGATL
ncbi:MAG: ROK family protein [Clostridia bacterium]